ncbi:HIRAN domain-containing protein [Rhizobium sp. Root482]|uniref:HIRAN domain-containing protein n=1 Tax=Rhizobium sp. Root482 TaxID=1736543 RepID=UPI0006F99B98|nr:HIRAN domain-containing protein [Rhizobium sp. Root482]KQY12714.1 hypothetical protein ASD31_15950 [Rhizobium sp. Root482]
MIEHIVEPNRLLLTWQAPDSANNRTRFAVGQLEAGLAATFRYFSEEEFFSINDTPLGIVRRLGFAQYPAFNPDRPIHNSGVLEAFSRRLPPRSRSDFADYRAHFRLGLNVKVSDFALLGITEAKLPGDGFALVDPFDDRVQPREILLEVAGYRHYAKNCSLENSIGEGVEFVAERDNAYDKNAVMINALSQKIGYVNKFQCSAFLTWMREGRITAVIERLNGEPGRPRAHVFARIAGGKASSLAA